MFNFINHIPEHSLGRWQHWLTVLAILVPILGAVTGGGFGYVAFIINGKIGAAKDFALRQAQDDATKAHELAVRLETEKQPRHLTEQQKASLSRLLANGPKGVVVLTTLSVEDDAPEYADEIGNVLRGAGYKVQISDKIWLRLKLGGIYLVSAGVNTAPPHAIFIQKCFQEVGIRVKGLNDPQMYGEFQPPIPEGAIIFVISNRGDFIPPPSRARAARISGSCPSRSWATGRR